MRDIFGSESDGEFLGERVSGGSDPPKGEGDTGSVNDV